MKNYKNIFKERKIDYSLLMDLNINSYLVNRNLLKIKGILFPIKKNSFMFNSNNKVQEILEKIYNKNLRLFHLKFNTSLIITRNSKSKKTKEAILILIENKEDIDKFKECFEENKEDINSMFFIYFNIDSRGDEIKFKKVE